MGTVSAFITQISTNGTLLNYSSYLGGSKNTYGHSIVVLNENASPDYKEVRKSYSRAGTPAKRAVRWRPRSLQTRADAGAQVF